MDLNDIENRSQNHVKHSSKFHYLYKYIEQFTILNNLNLEQHKILLSYFKCIVFLS